MNIRLALLGATFAALSVSGNLAADTRAQFSKADRAAIAAYYDAADRARFGQGFSDARGNGKSHGKAHGRKTLPPGIQRQLARGKPLPPGLETRSLPSDLRSNLKPPRGHDVMVVDGRVMLVEARTRLVRDLIEGAIYR